MHNTAEGRALLSRPVLCMLNAGVCEKKNKSFLRQQPGAMTTGHSPKGKKKS